MTEFEIYRVIVVVVLVIQLSLITTGSTIVREAGAIAVLPLPPGERVHFSKDKNIILLKDGWRLVDFEKQYQHGKPPPPFDDKHLRPDSVIRVLIASLRETRLKDTLVSMITNAAHPERIKFGIVQQNAAEDEDIVVEFCRAMGTPLSGPYDPQTFIPNDPNQKCKYIDNIKVLRMLNTEARGPAYARALGNKLVDFEEDDFCMQIDAHTKVVPQWDVLLLEDWAKAQNEFAVLTTYPTNVHDLGKNTGDHWEMPHLCCAEGSKGVMVNCQAKAAAKLDAPLLAPLWAAGLSFSKCHAEKIAPNDPNLKGVFAGEEYARGVRLWTHGYDFYSNSRPWIGTYYGGEKGGKSFHWKTDSIREAHARMATLVRAEGADVSPDALAKLEPYGLGTKRTLEQYIEFTGIDPRNGNTKNAICAGVYVPWYKSTSVPAISVDVADQNAMLRGGGRGADKQWHLKRPTDITVRGQVLLGVLILVVMMFSVCLLVSKSRVCIGKAGRKD